MSDQSENPRTLGRGVVNNVYLHLFHGRKDPTENLEDWGEDGPCFGPLDNVSVTYTTHIKFTYADGRTASFCDLMSDGDMIYYNGMWYDDWCVLASANGKPLAVYDEALSVYPSSIKEETPVA